MQGEWGRQQPKVHVSDTAMNQLSFSKLSSKKQMPGRQQGKIEMDIQYTIFNRSRPEVRMRADYTKTATCRVKPFNAFYYENWQPLLVPLKNHTRQILVQVWGV